MICRRSICLILLAASCHGLAWPAAAQFVLTHCTGEAFADAVASQSHILLSCEGTIAPPRTIFLTNDLIIEGTGTQATLRNASGQRFMLVSSNVTLTLVNVTFADSFLTNGGAVFWNEGHIIAHGCVFRGNTMRGADGVAATFSPGRPASGGVVFQNGPGRFTAIGCTFSNNAAIGGNGASAGAGASTWGGSGQGGAAYIAGGSAAFTNCLFTDNRVVGGSGGDLAGGGFGGALLFDGGTTGWVVHCTFSNNTARASNSTVPSGGFTAGGAIWADGVLRVADCFFTSNRAEGGLAGPAHGGAIHSALDLRVESSRFWRNHVVGGTVGNNAPSFAISGGTGAGGALTTGGRGSVTDSLFEGNTATGGGGGRTSSGTPTRGGVGQGGACNTFTHGAELYLTNCALVGHTTQGGDGGRLFVGEDAGEGRGAAVFLSGTGGALVNCTVAWNTNRGGVGGSLSQGGGGGWARGAVCVFTGDFVVAHCTLATNRVIPGSGAQAGRAQGASLFNFNAALRLFGNVIAGPMGTTNITGSHADGGFNLCSDNSLFVSSVGSAATIDPRLGPPAFNGGPTPTLALLPGSPALNAIPPGTPGVPPTDQRGVIRPHGSASDIGAFELGAAGRPFLTMARTAEAVEVLVRGEAGHRYRLLAAPEVTNNIWMETAAGVAVSNGPLSFTISNHLPREFFRAVTP